MPLQRFFAPQRRQQRGPTGAGRQAVIHHLARRVADHLPGADGVVLQRQVGQTPGSPRAGGTAGHDVQRMQLDAIHAGRHHPLQREQMIALVFSRQPDDQMAAHLQPALPGRCAVC